MNAFADIARNFEAKAFGRVINNCQLADITYWRIGGTCRTVFYPNSTEALAYLLPELARRNISHAVVGKTSNLLFANGVIEGALVILGKAFDYINYCSNSTFKIGGASSVPWTCYALGARGYSGLEHCVGIPGTFGGLVYMNGGSMRKAIGDSIENVFAFDRHSGRLCDMARDDCDFSYRHSVFQSDKFIILEATVSLTQESTKAVKSEMLHILRSRRKKFPLDRPSCGSVFKANAEVYEKLGPPGAIIEKLGLKGRSNGGAKISQRHANFIINNGRATAKDVFSLVRLCRDTCEQEFGIVLESEAKYVDRSLNIKPITDCLDDEGQR